MWKCGNVEMWKCGNVEMWKCGNVEIIQCAGSNSQEKTNKQVAANYRAEILTQIDDK